MEEIKRGMQRLEYGINTLIKSIGGDHLGNKGIAKRLVDVENIIEIHQPILKAYQERTKNLNKLKNTLIGCCITSILALIGSIIVHFIGK